jgi:esterase/lipase superfamily enzyme
MELLVFGHAGARAIVFPTQSGRFWDWEDRRMIETLSQHLENGWVQLYCVDSVDQESWDNVNVGPRERAARHLQYQDYIMQEVLPITASKNDNPYTMAIGASFGAYHSVNIALRFPAAFNRVVAMSGIYDIRPWTGGYDDELVYQGNPYEYIRGIQDEEQLANIRKIDTIIAIGEDDPAYLENEQLSKSLWNRGVWHAFRVWDGWAHDWPFWQQMIVQYIGGPESKA